MAKAVREREPKVSSDTILKLKVEYWVTILFKSYFKWYKQVSANISPKVHEIYIQRTEGAKNIHVSCSLWKARTEIFS